MWGKYVANAEFQGGDPDDPLAACPARIDTPDPAVAARIKTEDAKLAALLEKDGPSHLTAYVDGGMHPSFRALLKQSGPKKLAEKISNIDYPVSRPDAALADLTKRTDFSRGLACHTPESIAQRRTAYFVAASEARLVLDEMGPRPLGKR
ncbi:hypothetical protein EV128_105296 [Rhizobium azibense]|nr:hypothetical protein EV128_105296 [Rhizobium azibense]